MYNIEGPQYILITSYGLLIPVSDIETYKRLELKYKKIGVECTLLQCTSIPKE